MDLQSLIAAFFTSPGVGGMVILAVFGIACVIYTLLLRWILRGGKPETK